MSWHGDPEKGCGMMILIGIGILVVMGILAAMALLVLIGPIDWWA